MKLLVNRYWHWHVLLYCMLSKIRSGLNCSVSKNWLPVKTLTFPENYAYKPK